MPAGILVEESHESHDFCCGLTKNMFTSPKRGQPLVLRSPKAIVLNQTGGDDSVDRGAEGASFPTKGTAMCRRAGASEGQLGDACAAVPARDWCSDAQVTTLCT